MIGARGVELYGKARCAGPCQLFSVQPRLEAAGAARGQNPPRLGNRECPAVAEDVTELRQPSPRYRGDQLPRQRVHVRVSPIGPAAKFRRHNVRAQKSRDDIERLQLEQLAVPSEDFQLARSIEAIAAFGLEGSGAVRGEILEGSKRSEERRVGKECRYWWWA